MKKKVTSLFLVLLMLFGVFSVGASAQSVLSVNGIRTISKYGNLKLKVTVAQVLDVFEYGDILTVSFNGISLDVPLCMNYSDVDAGCLGLFVRIDGSEDEVILAEASGTFAEKYGVAIKQVNADKTYVWNYNKGFSADMVFELALKEKAGYLEEYSLRSISYTDNREDYPHLTDAEFANFRNVTAGTIGKGILYRSASPVEAIHNRNTYADACAEKAKVTYFINLAESEEVLTSYEGYADTYYATVNHIAVAATVNYTSLETQKAFAEAFIYMANHKGVYDVHCREGKERTGFFIAISECLMNADYEEICEDYMLTYRNYYGISEADASYSLILEGSFVKTLNQLFDTDIQSANLKKEAEEYLKQIGLKNSEILSLRANLSGNGFVGTVLNVLAGFYRVTEKLTALFSLSGTC